MLVAQADLWVPASERLNEARERRRFSVRDSRSQCSQLGDPTINALQRVLAIGKRLADPTIPLRVGRTRPARQRPDLVIQLLCVALQDAERFALARQVVLDDSLVGYLVADLADRLQLSALLIASCPESNLEQLAEVDCALSVVDRPRVIDHAFDLAQQLVRYAVRCAQLLYELLAEVPNATFIGFRRPRLAEWALGDRSPVPPHGRHRFREQWPCPEDEGGAVRERL